MEGKVLEGREKLFHQEIENGWVLQEGRVLGGGVAYNLG